MPRYGVINLDENGIPGSTYIISTTRNKNGAIVGDEAGLDIIRYRIYSMVNGG